MSAYFVLGFQVLVWQYYCVLCDASVCYVILLCYVMVLCVT